MSGYLKGNYPLDATPGKQGESQPEDSEQQFYRRALEKLGGSIAFVLKSKKLVWNGKDDDTTGN